MHKRCKLSSLECDFGSSFGIEIVLKIMSQVLTAKQTNLFGLRGEKTNSVLKKYSITSTYVFSNCLTAAALTVSKHGGKLSDFFKLKEWSSLLFPGSETTQRPQTEC